MGKLYVTNNHTNAMEFEVEGGGSQVVEPGKTEYFALLNPNSPQNIANQHVGLVSISDKNPEKSSEKAESGKSASAPASSSSSNS